MLDYIPGARRVNLLMACRRLLSAQVARGADYWIRLIRDRQFRLDERARRDAFEAFSKEYGDLLLCLPPEPAGPQRNALLIGFGVQQYMALELTLAKTLELAGYRPVILARRNPWLASYYGLVQSARVVFWRSSSSYRSKARKLLSDCGNVDSLSRTLWRGYRPGRSAIADVVLKRGEPFEDWSQPEVREQLISSLAASLAYLDQAQRLVSKFKPALAFVSDKMQSPEGEVVDVCRRNGVETVAHFDSTRRGAMIVQRVTAANVELYPRTTVSEPLWQALRSPQSVSWCEHLTNAVSNKGKYDGVSSMVRMPEDHAAKLGESVLAMLGWNAPGRAQLLARLGFDGTKKVVGIFPRPFWDVSFLWGRHLAKDHSHWLLETITAAVQNPRVDWYIKLHPSYKARLKGGDSSEPPEVRLIRKRFGPLPPHIFLIPPSDEVTAPMLFDITNVCVTGSATVAVEAAARGIPAITSVIGEHDRRGFTVDFDTLDAYLAQLQSVEQIPALSPSQVDLARRYAWGAFVLRPFRFTSITEESVPGTDRQEYRFAVRSLAQLAAAPDVQAFIRWLRTPGVEDLHSPPACPECAAATHSSAAPESVEQTLIAATHDGKPVVKRTPLWM